MSKKKKQKALPSKPVVRKPPTNFFSQHPNWSAVILLFLLLIIFYYPIVFENKTLLPPDKLTAMSYHTFVNSALKDGIYPLWNPYIFSGMPSFASLSSAPLINIFDTAINYSLIGIGKVLPLTPFIRVMINYLFFGLLIYLLLTSLNINRYACLFSAIAIMFMPQFVAFTAFGHNTKFLSLILIPLIFWAVHQLFTKRNLLFFTLTALALGFQLLRAHVQVCYYTYLFVGFYFIYYAITEFVETKNYKHILSSAGLLVCAGLAALMLSSVMYISVYEYSQYSIRGGGASGGLDYGYASSWSFSPAEMITFFIPSYFGFGGATYWGDMPFTDYPLYMGIAVLFLAGLALVIKRNRFVIFFTIIAVFSLLVSFGKHLPILYNPMFKLLPFFNKFRVPSMIHILLNISVVVLAGFGLHYLIKLKDAVSEKIDQQKLQAVKLYSYIFAGAAILFLLIITIGKGAVLKAMGESFTQRHSNTSLQQIEQLKMAAYQSALTDTVVMLILLGLAIFFTLYFLRSKLSPTLLSFGLILVLIVDLWIVDFKIIDPQPAVDEKNFFQKTDAVKFLEKQNQPFRMLSIPLKPDNWWMYFKLQNVYGYHAAKLKIYQEAMDQLNFNHNFLNMLNTKYLISQNAIRDTSYQLIFRGQQMIYENKHALPRAFFVNDIIVLNSKNEIFSLLKSPDFNPAQTAILEENPLFEIESKLDNQVTLESCSIHQIKMKASVAAPALLVLSEIYYPAGWNAYVDGATTKIFKTNYILRSIFLKPGVHEIEFKFEPSSFKIGLLISSVTFFALIATLIISFRKQKK